MTSDFQARVASEVLWQEDKLLQSQYGEHAKYEFTNNCYLPMRMALEAAKKAAEWESETKSFEQTFKVITKSGETYVEAVIDPKGRRRLIGPFGNERKAQEWITTYGSDRLTPDIVEFARDSLTETSWR